MYIIFVNGIAASEAETFEEAEKHVNLLKAIGYDDVRILKAR